MIQRALVVNVSAPAYNLGAEKIASWREDALGVEWEGVMADQRDVGIAWKRLDARWWRIVWWSV